MLKINFLRNLLFLTIALAAGFPLYDYFYTYPAYSELLIKQTESEASRFVRYLVAFKGLERFDLDNEPFFSEITKEIEQLKDDELLVKLRIFSSTGRIVYSTQHEEYGILNTNDYFTQQVAKGKIYSKVVKKNHSTADGDLLVSDVAETYVPIMVAGRFHGAVEVYYDITAEQARLQQLNKQAAILLVIFSAVFVLLMFIGLTRAKRSFLALQRAERSLQVANETLETRVVQRTEQLQLLNDKLSEEIQVRQRAEIALQAALSNVSDARDKIDTILSSVADALIVTDSDNRVVHMNQLAERFFQVDSWQVGAPFQQVMNTPELLRKVTEARQSLTGDQVAEFDLTLFTAETSQSQILAARATRLLTEQGEERGMVILLQDATRIRNVERMKSEFVSIAAHELRTPLTIILGYSELLLENRTFSDVEEQEFLGVINRKAVDLSLIVDDLLDVSRIEEGRQLDLHLVKVDFGQLIERTVSEAKLLDKQIYRFIVNLPDAPCFVSADRVRMQQVLDNLLSNAMKYSPQGGEISIDLILKNQSLLLTVADQGIGMTDAQIERAFDRFYRAEFSDAAIRGVGLGLSIVKYIVEAHGGSVSIKSRIGQGTSITLALPDLLKV
ncbi:MAG TPA: ATP-binding protein [Malonomonas sp.]